jgi:hypothetical protein
MWPVVLGVISAAFAGVGLMMGPVTLLTGGRLGQAPGQYDVNQYFPDWYKSYQSMSVIAGMAIGALQLAGGLSLLRRKPIARPLLLIVAFFGVVATIVNIAVFASMDLSGMPPTAQSIFRTVMLGALPLGFGYPVFLIVWFFRGKIVQEVGSWRQQGR